MYRFPTKVSWGTSLWHSIQLFPDEPLAPAGSPGMMRIPKSPKEKTAAANRILTPWFILFAPFRAQEPFSSFEQSPCECGEISAAVTEASPDKSPFLVSKFYTTADLKPSPFP
jgi:hypothetical protein